MLKQGSLQLTGNINSDGNNQNSSPLQFTLEANKSYQINVSGSVKITNGVINLTCRAKNMTQSFSKDSNLQLEYSCVTI